MKNKTVEKKDLDKLIRILRKYWQTGDREMLDAKHCVCDQISKRTGTSTFAFSQVIDSIVMDSGLCPGATNEMIYGVFEAMGWVITGRGDATNG